MEPRSKRREKLLLVSLLVSLASVAGLAIWVYTAPYRFPRPPLPPGSQVSILVWGSYLNDTGAVRGTSYVEGMNITFSDISNGTVFSIVTPSKILEVNLVVGHNYHATAMLGVSSKSADAIVGGYGGILEVLVWDNQTIRSANFGMLTH